MSSISSCGHIDLWLDAVAADHLFVWATLAACWLAQDQVLASLVGEQLNGGSLALTRGEQDTSACLSCWERDTGAVGGGAGCGGFLAVGELDSAAVLLGVVIAWGGDGGASKGENGKRCGEFHVDSGSDWDLSLKRKKVLYWSLSMELLFGCDG